MAIYHCSTKPLSRSSGRSAVAAAAYRSGDCLTDERQGLEHDYTRRSGVLHSELVLPDDVGEWTRSELWNAAEQAEKRKDGRTAREWEVALPDELSHSERRDLAVSFAQDLAERYGCAVDVAVHAPDREGDQRNWHAHLLATTREVSNGELGDKCTIELSDAKRLSLGYEPARKEIEAVRETWAEHVNQFLERAGQEDRVDHRSLVDQRDEAVRNNEPEKAAELDREPQVKLGWKVVQMQRRGEPSDRADQLHRGEADNTQRKAAVIDIGELRDRLANREAEARQRDLDRVAEFFKGLPHRSQERIVDQWRHLAGQKVPDIENARKIWEQDRWDPDANAWRETNRTIQWETEKVGKSARAIEAWHASHPVKSLLVRSGLQKNPVQLESLEQERSQAEHFLAGSRTTLEKLERAWSAKQPEYEQKLGNEGRQIAEARENLKVIQKNPDHFAEVFDREHNRFQERIQQKMSRSAAQRGSSPSHSGKTPDREPENKPERNRDRGHDRDDGWSR